jgi:hypothetical protein
VDFPPNWLMLALLVSWADISRPLTLISGYRPDYRTGLTITFCSRCLGGEKIYQAI